MVKKIKYAQDYEDDPIGYFADFVQNTYRSNIESFKQFCDGLAKGNINTFGKVVPGICKGKST